MFSYLDVDVLSVRENLYRRLQILISSRNSFMEQEVFDDETIPRPRSLFGPTGQEPGRSRHLMWNNIYQHSCSCSCSFPLYHLILTLILIHIYINPDPHDPHQWDAPHHCRQKIAPRSSHNVTQPSCSPR